MALLIVSHWSAGSRRFIGHGDVELCTICLLQIQQQSKLRLFRPVEHRIGELDADFDSFAGAQGQNVFFAILAIVIVLTVTVAERVVVPLVLIRAWCQLEVLEFSLKLELGYVLGEVRSHFPPRVIQDRTFAVFLAIR